MEGLFQSPRRLPPPQGGDRKTPPGPSSTQSPGRSYKEAGWDLTSAGTVAMGQTLLGTVLTPLARPQAWHYSERHPARGLGPQTPPPPAPAPPGGQRYLVSFPTGERGASRQDSGANTGQDSRGGHGAADPPEEAPRRTPRGPCLGQAASGTSYVNGLTYVSQQLTERERTIHPVSEWREPRCQFTTRHG